MHDVWCIVFICFTCVRALWPHVDCILAILVVFRSKFYWEEGDLQAGIIRVSFEQGLSFYLEAIQMQRSCLMLGREKSS